VKNVQTWGVHGVCDDYLEVESRMPSWWRKIIPSKNDREIRRYKSRVEQINALEASMKALPDEALRAKTEEFRQRFKEAVAKFGR